MYPAIKIPICNNATTTILPLLDIIPCKGYVQIKASVYKTEFIIIYPKLIHKENGKKSKLKQLLESQVSTYNPNI